MNLKNYTTEVAASKCIDNIERLLVEFGATRIMKEFTEVPNIPGRICSQISFMVEIDGSMFPFKLRANIHNVIKWYKSKKPTSSDKNIAEQSQRIAWKQQYELLHLQLGQIEMDQLEKMEVFFPYLYDINKDETYYQKIKQGGFKALLPLADSKK